MKVRIAQPITIGQPDTDEPYSAAIGDVVEVTTETAQHLVGNGRAEWMRKQDVPTGEFEGYGKGESVPVPTDMAPEAVEEAEAAKKAEEKAKKAKKVKRAKKAATAAKDKAEEEEAEEPEEEEPLVVETATVEPAESATWPKF